MSLFSRFKKAVAADTPQAPASSSPHTHTHAGSSAGGMPPAGMPAGYPSGAAGATGGMPPSGARAAAIRRPDPSEEAAAAAAAAQAERERLASSLGPEYYDPSFDPIRRVLADMPHDPDAQERFFQSVKLSQQRVLDAVSARLSKEVVANYEAFIHGMKQISEIDMDCSRAGVHISNSARKLANAKAGLVLGTLGITYRRRRRERLAEVNRHLKWLRSLHQLESNVGKACAERKYADAVQLVVDAQTRLRDATTASFTVLSSLRPRVDGALESLRGRMDKALDGVCMHFDAAAYSSILLAFRELDESGMKAAVRTSVQPPSTGGGRFRAATAIGDEDVATSVAELHLPGERADEPGQRGQALLAEVGGSIAAATAASTSGVLSIRGIGPADGNLAALVSHVNAAATKAVKALTKDVIIDLLLRDSRKKLDAEEQERERQRREGLDENDEHDAGDEGDSASRRRHGSAGDVADELAGMTAEPASTASAASRKRPETAADEYARKRNDMRQRAFNDLCSSIPPEDIPQACMRVAGAIVHVMHNHYLLLQYHRHPFDPRNNYEDCEFLHASGVDDDFDPTAEDPDDASHIAAAKTAASRTSGRGGVGGGDGAAFVIVLKELRAYLLRARGVIWQQMQQRFAAMLTAAVSAAGVALPVERLAQCLIVARDLMTVGLEYVGFGRRVGSSGGAARSSSAAAVDGLDLDPCNTLRSALRLLCSQFMEAIHAEAFDKLRGMLSKELWQRVPVTEQVMHSIMDSAQAGLRHKLTKGAYAAIAAATAAIKGTDTTITDAGADAAADSATLYRAYSDGASLFATWIDRGNPFGAVRLTDFGRGGATVLPTPRRVVDEDDDEDDEDEDEFETGAAARPSGGETEAKTEEEEAAAEAARAAAAQRRAAARLLRYIHGEDYALEIGLGRGPGLGFSLLVGSDTGGRRTVDSDDDDSEDDVITDTGRDSSEDDSDDDDAPASDSRARKTGGADGDDGTFKASTTAVGPYAAVLGGQHQHVVTAAALNGFARTVGKYIFLMEMLPTVASEAFTGLAHLFELYLYTVATLFIRPGALNQLWNLATPAPASSEPDHNLSQFDYMDGAALAASIRASSCAAEARAADHRQLGSTGRALGLRRANSAGTSSTFSPSASVADDDGMPSLSSASAARRKGGERSESEAVDLFGVTVYLRGLPAIAQSQGLPPDYYLATGAGAAAGAVMGGNSFGAECVYTLLRRSLQLIGFMLSQGTAARTATASVLAEGTLAHDTGLSSPGIVYEPYVKLQASVEVEGEAAAFGICERGVAAESLDFLLDVLARVRPRLESQLPAAQASTLNNFYAHAVLACCQVRALLYHALVPRLVPETGALPNIVTSNVKWEAVKDAMEPSGYVPMITAPLSRAATLLNDRAAGGSLPSVSRLGIWSCITNHVMERFVEGISRVKKCTVPGRGVMALDAGAIYTHCTKVGPILPLCITRDADFARAYISAFYFESDADVLHWMLGHKSQYALRHMRAIITNGIGATLKKKQLKDVTQSLDAMYMLQSTAAPAPGATLAGMNMSGLLAGAAAVMGGGSS